MSRNRGRVLRSSKECGGFTLVEMLVVIAIILILMSLLAMLIKGVIDRARYKHTDGIVNTLKMSCENYRTDEGQYPPASYSGYSGSVALHFLLGRERSVFTSRGGGGTVVKRDPYIVFSPSWLEGKPPSGDPNPPKKIVDAWMKEIVYSNPKPGAAANLPSYLILSWGRDEADGTGDEIRSDKTDN